MKYKIKIYIQEVSHLVGLSWRRVGVILLHGPLMKAHVNQVAITDYLSWD